MCSAFDFDEYWYNFTQFPDPEIFDPVIDIRYPNKVEDFPKDVLTLFP